MASIPENIRILWPSGADTPTGWTTDSTFDNVMPYSANSGSGTGGANTHNHNGNNHSHPGGSHGHPTGNIQTNVNSQAPTGQYRWWSINNSASWFNQVNHNHSSASIGNANTPGSSGSNGNYGGGSNDPAYYTFRIIKSDGTGDGFPAGSVVLWNTASNPTTESGWSQHGGSVGKFVRGASSGGNAAGGGCHTHSSAGNHTHGGGGGSHTHPAGNTSSGSSGPAGGPPGCEENINISITGSAHTHSIPSAGPGTAGSGTGSGSGGNATGTSIEPPYISVWGVTNSSNSWLEGGIGFISGETLSTFTDEGWVLCNGSNSTPNLNGSKFIKLSGSGGAVGATGNQTSHNHPASGGSHSHPGGGSHGHTLSGSVTGIGNHIQTTDHPWHTVYSANNYAYPAEQYRYSSPPTWQFGHEHPISTTATGNATTGTYNAGTQNVAQANSVYPSYKTVTWIMAPEEPAEGGGNVGMFGSNF